MESRISVGNNIARMRKEHKLTQDELASFLGVTKASVPKWENRQSYPDIELLPRNATYFGVSIDELVGYEPQMDKREIRSTRARLRAEFAEEPFAQVNPGLCQGCGESGFASLADDSRFKRIVKSLEEIAR